MGRVDNQNQINGEAENVPNKRGGWNFLQKSIKGEVLIRAGRVDFFPKINKRASPFIKQVRVIGVLFF